MFVQIDDDNTRFGELVSVEIFTTMCYNINYLIDSMPIGTIIPILVGFPNVPEPDSNLWQECDGSLISNSTSPLRGSYAPDYKTDGRYMRNYENIGDVGNLGGSNMKNLSHSHGGNTGENPSMETNADSDNDFWTGKNHTHTIDVDLGTYNFEPKHVRIKHYIKINYVNDKLAGKFRDFEYDFGTSIAQALWTKAAKDINSFDKSYPVGMVMFFYATQSNLPKKPDSQYWQLLNGSVVNNANSPLNGQTLPDLSHMFIRHPKADETALSTGGTDSVNLSHDHGGLTGDTNDRNDFQMDGGGERAEADVHHHEIYSDLGTFSTVPEYVELQCYVRIA